MTLQLFARVQALLHCPECLHHRIGCPTCGEEWGNTGSRVGAQHTLTCDCGPGLETLITVEVTGYMPNPSGEGPPPAALSDDLRRLSRSWAQPAAPPVSPPQQPARMGTPAPRPSPWPLQRLQSSPQQQRRSTPRGKARLRARRASKPAKVPTRQFEQPCPPDQPRWRFARFVEAAGWIPEGVAPCAVAAAYVRLFGVSPRRDPLLPTGRVYSAREMRLALEELSSRAKQQQPTDP